MKETTTIRNSLLFIVLLNIIAVSVCGYLFYSIKTKVELTAELSHKLAEDTNQGKVISDAEQELKSLEKKVSELDSYILKEKDLLVFLTEIESTAKAVGVSIKKEIKDISVPNQKTDVKGPLLQFNISVEGSWSEVWAMLALIENIPYQIDMQNFSVRVSPDEKSGNVWKGEIGFIVVTAK